MNALLADALQDCLERIEAGEPVGAALARHAALTADLRPLILAAMLVREHRPLPTPGFRARVQVALANIDLDAAPDATGAPGPAASPHRAAWRPLVARLTGALLAVVMLSGGVVVASANSRPGDLLYPVRRGVEQARDAAVGALMPVVTGVQAPRPADIESAARPTQAALPAPGRADRRGSGAQRAEGAERDASPGDGAEGAGGSTRPRGRPGFDQGRPDAMPEAVAAGAREQSAAAPTALPTPTAEAQAVAIAPEPTMTPGGLDRPQPGSAPTQAIEARASAVTPEPGPTVEPARVDLIPLPDLPPSGNPGRGGIAGIVTREDGSPREAVRIYLYPPKPEDDRGRWYPWRETRSGEDGRYRFDNLRPGRYIVLAAYSTRRGNTVWRWYPNATDPDDAEEITVSAGYIRDAIDFRLDRLPWVADPFPIPFPWPRGS